MKNAQNALLRAAPKIVQAYIKTALRGNPTVLVDSRKWIMPTDGESANPSTSQMLIFVGESPMTPRAIDAATDAVPALIPDTMTPQQVVVSPNPA